MRNGITLKLLNGGRMFEDRPMHGSVFLGTIFADYMSKKYNLVVEMESDRDGAIYDPLDDGEMWGWCRIENYNMHFGRYDEEDEEEDDD